jgi:ketosteroid isomerase-like protein
MSAQRITPMMYSRPMTRTTVLGLLAGAVLLLGADKSAEDAVKQADQQVADAVMKNDLATLERILGDDLTYSHSTGRVETKAQFIGVLKSGEMKYESVQMRDASVRLYGNTAILTGSPMMKTNYKGQASTADLKVLRVYMKRGGVWKLVAHQSTRLAQ